MELNDWNVAASSNNAAPPHGWPENTMQYSEVNDTAREGMAVIARFVKDTNGSLAAAGLVNAYTVSLNASYAAYFAGMTFTSTIPITNTGASTMNVNALGTRNIFNSAGAAIGAGFLIAGNVYRFVYVAAGHFRVVGAVPANLALTDAANIFTQTQTIAGGSPTLRIDETDAPANNGNWGIIAGGEAFLMRAYDDAWSAFENFIAVQRTNETIDSVNLLAADIQFNSGDLPVSMGGTAASTAAAARTNLGLVIGTDVQAYDADLTALSTISKGDGNFAVGDGTTWVSETPSTARASLGLGTMSVINAPPTIGQGGTGATTQGPARTNLGVGTGDSPEFLEVNIGNPTDTPITRSAAGKIKVDGHSIFSWSGTTAAYTSARVFEATAAPTTEGTNGDIYFEREA